MSSKDTEFSSNNGYSIDDRLEKIGFLSELESRSLQHSFFQRICSVKTFVTTLPWLLVVILTLALAHEPKPPVTGDAELELDRYSPAYNEIEYHDVVFKRGFGPNKDTYSDYQGWPTDEIDRLWDESYENGFSMHINSTTHDRLYNKTMHFPVHGYESSYVVGLDVFHQLHCLNKIRKAFYPHRYNNSMINHDGTVDWAKWMHIDHCIESLRQSITCSSDVTANGFDWFPQTHYMRPRLDTVHKCRNFSRIKEFAFERFIPLNNLQSHVEADGVLVDYTGVFPDPEATENWPSHSDWHYTVDDM